MVRKQTIRKYMYNMLLMIYIPIREKVEPTRAFFTLMHGLSTHSSFVKGQAFCEVTKNYPTVCTCQQRRKNLFCLLSTVCINICYLQWSSYLYWNQPFSQCSLKFPGKLKLHVCLKIWTSNVVMSRVDFPLPTYTVSICGTAAV